MGCRFARDACAHIYLSFALTMHIAITGGAGFIGTSLTKALLLEGHSVLIIDDFSSSSRDTLAVHKGHPLLDVMEQDITRPLVLPQSVRYIYNLACPASPVWYQKDPVKTVRTNVEGMINVLECAREIGARVLQASTSEVYGDPTEHPQRETYRGNVNTLGPRACYDEGKRCAETLCMDYERQYGVEVRIVRIFNTYGPYMAKDDGRVVSNFILQALAGEPITIYGDGSQTRSFQYVSDLVRGIRLLMDAENIEGPVNIGNPNEFTIKELAERVIALTHSSSEIEYKALPKDDPKQRRPDISEAQRLLGWEPTIQLEEGLLSTIEYFKSLS